MPEIVTLPVPALVTATDWVVLEPVFTLPKLSAVGLRVRSSEGALTVSVAAPLVTLPAELPAATANCVPLSAVVVAGVVYEDEVAPLMAAPFFIH